MAVIPEEVSEAISETVQETGKVMLAEQDITETESDAEETDAAVSELQTEAVQQTEQEVNEEVIDAQILSEADDEQEKFQAKLKIVTVDADTKQPIKIPNTEFRVYDLDHECYVEQVTSYPQVYLWQKICYEWKQTVLL